MRRAEFHATAESGAGRRLDVFLAGSLPELSRSRIRRIIEEGGVTVDGAARKPGYRLGKGERIAVAYEELEAGLPQPEDLPLKIIHSDVHVVVIDKPSGLVVHPGAGRWKGTLVSALMHRFPEIAGVGPPERPGIVHRLDKETSGVMVAARTARAYGSLVEQFKRREVRKIYLGLVRGKMPASEGRFSWAVGRHVRRGARISIRTRRPKEAETHYRVLREYRETSLLEIRPVTGRTHQIRVHLAAAGHSLVGDGRYGGKGRGRGCEIRLFLHAHRLSFIHPETEERVEFVSELPRELADFIEKR